MKVTELRIGNYVRVNKKANVKINDIGNAWHTHLPIKDDGFNWVSPKTRVKQYEPAPLTEEWLLKFGFMKSKQTLTNNYISKCGLVTIYKMPNGKIFANGVVEDIYLPYMHTLQNLYFALTNKELTIK